MTQQQCAQCNKTFSIEPRDLEFYKKIQVPIPFLCPNCRRQRRLAWRNERTLYNRICDLCKKTFISMCKPNTPYTVYCQDCWWSDQWDAADYALDYNANKPFFEQFGELMQRVPQMGHVNRAVENCDYTNYCMYDKDCYLTFATDQAEEVHYSYWANYSKYSSDLYNTQKCELCYYCVDCENCYNCYFSQNCQGSHDLMFCYDVVGSSNCILSTNLRNREYYILNKKYSKGEYEKEAKKYRLASAAQLIELRKRFEEIKKMAIHRYAQVIKSENVSGNYISHSREANYCFNAVDVENSRYIGRAYQNIRDCMDCDGIQKSELVYETQCCQLYNSMFCNICFNSQYLQYSHQCFDSKYLFGCVGMRKQTYAILNKTYSEEKYMTLVKQIVTSLNRTGKYGVFFDPQLSLFGYNESVAMEQFPVKPSEATNRGFRWEEHLPYTYGKETLTLDKVPDNIDDISDDILNEILACENCKKNYKIVKKELDYYRQYHIALPHICPDCRHADRYQWRNPETLWQRQCMCTQIDHNHAGRCITEFDTSYSPERKEIVYCEECYQKEVY